MPPSRSSEGGLAGSGTDGRPKGPQDPPELWERLILALGLNLCFSALYSLANSLAAREGRSYLSALPLDSVIPFLPGFALIYLSAIPLPTLPFLVVARRDALYAHALSVSLAVLAATAVFVIWPVHAPPLPAGNPGWLLHLADRMNLDFNGFPSLHMALSLWAVLAMAPELTWRARPVLMAWVILIAVSVLVTRQHYLLDALGGLVLAVATNRLVYPACLRLIQSGPQRIRP